MFSAYSPPTVEAVVEFDYEAQQDDELSLTVGDIIVNIRRDDGGWWEGELGGRRGFFPDNFVRVSNQNLSAALLQESKLWEFLKRSACSGRSGRGHAECKCLSVLCSRVQVRCHLLPPNSKCADSQVCHLFYQVCIRGD